MLALLNLRSMLAKFILLALFSSSAFAVPPSNLYSIDHCPLRIIQAASPPFSERTLDFSSIVTLKPGDLLSQKQQQVITLVMNWVNSKTANFGGNFEYVDFIEGFKAYDEHRNALLAVGMRGNDWTLALENAGDNPKVRVGIDFSVCVRGQELDLKFKLSHWVPNGKTPVLQGVPRFYRDLMKQLEGEVYSLQTLLSALPVVLRSGEARKLIELLGSKRAVPLVYLTRRVGNGIDPVKVKQLAAKLAGRALVIQVEPDLADELVRLNHRMLGTRGRVAIFDAEGAMQLLPDLGDPFTLMQIETRIPTSTGAIPAP